MSDDTVEPDTPAYTWLKNARHIDKAVNQIDKDGFFTTGWALVRVSQSVEDDPSSASFSFFDPPNQPIHITRGLYEMAVTEYDQRCRMGSVEDDDD